MRPRTILLCGLAVSAVVWAGSLGGSTFAAFSSQTNNTGNVITSKRIFPATRSVSPWAFFDRSTGTELTTSDDTFFQADGTDTAGQFVTTDDWPTSNTGTQFYEIDFNSQLPNGLTVNSVTFNFTFSDDQNGGGNNVCVNSFEVRSKTSGNLLPPGTAHTPTPNEGVGCSSTRLGAATIDNNALTEVTTTALANDLRIRIYATHSIAANPMRIDRATVTGNVVSPVPTVSTAFTLFRQSVNDAADGSANPVAPWSQFAAGDGSAFTTGNWATTLQSTRHIRTVFPGFQVPVGATINSVVLRHTWRTGTNLITSTSQYQVFDGTTTQIGADVSGTTNNSGTTFTTEAKDLTSIINGFSGSGGPVGLLNRLQVRIQMSRTATGPTVHDFVSLDVDWHLD